VTNKIQLFSRVATLLGSCSVLMAAGTAYGQKADGNVSSDASSDTLQEVVVTATRRTEMQIDVPMSIAVISAKTIQAQEIQTFNDFATKVPNLSFNYGENPGANDRGVAIRGIQGADTTGFYLDDLPMPISLNPRVLDMNRIEVLRGPQGTLYGARSMGGTIRMITEVPDTTKFSGNVDVQGTSIDGGGNGYQVSGTFNIPLITDRLALRVTPFTGEDAGYINRVFPSASAPNTEEEVKNTAANKYEGVLASMLWKATDALTIRPTFMYQSAASNGVPLADYTASNLTNIRTFDIPETLRDKWNYAGLTIGYTTPIGDITSATSILNRHSYVVEDVSEFTAAAFSTPLLPSPITADTTIRVSAEEVRFASTWRGPLQFVGGLFFQKSDSVSSVEQILPEFLSIFGTGVVFDNWLPQRQEERAIFGELTYAFSDHWYTTIGARYSGDRTTTGGSVWGLAEGVVSAGAAISNATAESDSIMTPKFLVKYKANDNFNIYADAAKGFRPGAGQIPPPQSFCASTYAAYNLTPVELSSYNPDSLWSYEVGAKAITPDHRYSLNGAIFYIEWMDIREVLGFPACGFAANINSARATSHGVEIEFSAALAEGLLLAGGLGYNDAKIESPGALITVPPAGSPVQQNAPVTANFRAQYERPLGPGMLLILRGDYSYTSRSYSTTNSPVNPRLRPSYALTNVRASLQRSSFEYSLFIQNLADAHPNLGDQLSQAAEDPGRPRWETGVPRTYGVDIRFIF
jgi:iron complex outermembrane recepter protein